MIPNYSRIFLEFRYISPKSVIDVFFYFLLRNTVDGILLIIIASVLALFFDGFFPLNAMFQILVLQIKL